MPDRGSARLVTKRHGSSCHVTVLRFWPAIFKPGWTRRKKVPLGSCLDKQDRATCGLSGVYTHRKPGKKKIHWRGFAPGFWSGRPLANGTTGMNHGTRFEIFSVDMGTSQHRMARHDQSRLACVGWRLCVQPTAIAPYHPIRVARLGSWLKARAKSSARVPKVARRRTRLRSWGAGRAVTSPKCRPDDLPRPSSSHLSQIARQISLVPMGAAHRTPTTCHLHRFASSGHPVRVRLSAGWPEVEMAVMWAALPRSGT